MGMMGGQAKLARPTVLNTLWWGGVLWLLLFLGRFATQNPEVARIPYLLLVGAGLVLLFAVRHTRPWRLATPLDIGLLTAVFVLSLTAYFSLDPFRSWRLAWNWTAAIIAFYTAVGLLRLGSHPLSLARALAGIATLFAVFSYIELGSWLVSWLNAFGLALFPTGLPRLSGWTGSPNLLAVILNIGLMLSWSLWFVAKRRRAVWLALFIFLLPAFLLTGSRSAYVGFLVGLAVWAIGWAWFTYQGRIPRLVWTQLAVGGATAVALIFLFIFLLRGETLRFNLLDSVLYRGEFWRIIPLMLRDNWLFGTGPDTFGTYYVWHEPSVPPQFPFRAAHSLWFSWLGEAGLLGLLVVVLNGGGGGRFLWRARAYHYWTPIVLGFTAALATFAVHATFDTPDTWMMILGAVLLAGWLHLLLEAGIAFTPSTRHSRASSLWVVIWLILVTTAPVFAQAVQSYQRGLELAEAGDWPTAVDQFILAQAQLPFITYTPALHAEAYSRGVLALNDPEQLPTAIAVYEHLLTVAPGWPTHQANLAALYYAAGNTDTALALMQEASQRAPNHYVYLLNLARWQEEQGQIVAAETTLHTLHALRTNWPDASFWQTTPLRQKVAQSRQETRPPAWVIPEVTRAGWEALHQGEFDTAVSAFTAVLPQEASAHHGLAIIALLSHADPATVQAHQQRADLLNNRTLPALTLFVTDDEQNMARLALHTTNGQAVSDSYWRSLFQSASLTVDLLPQLHCLPVTGSIAQSWNFWHTSVPKKAMNFVDHALIFSSETIPCTRP